MSTLSMRLKQRARMLAAGVALSAATLALIPGVAEATDPTGCVCRLVGDITDTGNPSPGPSDGSQETSDGPDNSAKLVGLQDTSVLNGSEIGNDNVSGNPTGVSAPVLSDDSGSEFNNDANSTSSGNGGANSPSGDKQNDADVAGLQDTLAAKGAGIRKGNVSGNSTGVSAPVLSDDSGSQFDNDASSTSSGNSGSANSPSGDKQNDADVAGLQDTSVLNGSEIGNDNASGNSVSVSGPVLSDDSGSEFNNDASSTSSGNSGNGGANSPSGDKQNDADVALGQDTEVANDSRTGNNNASGNSTGVSAPIASDDSGSQFDNDASSTSSGNSGSANSPSGDKQNDADVA